jgi:1-acyl-sn-glycerol-3-phosphate acyltransferase
MDRQAGDCADQYPYPRRLAIRFLLRQGIRFSFALLSNLRITGRENLPAAGPLIVVANHFHFLDPLAVIRATPWPMEFLAGLQNPDAPKTLSWITRVWGVYTVRRGAASRTAMRASLSVLEQGGVLGVFPEGGSWASVLRPARPGTAYLAAQSGARLLPMGLDGFLDVFPSVARLRRARATVRIGRPFGPFHVEGRGHARRQQLEDIGNKIMLRIAELIPPDRRGVHSDDPEIPHENLMG